MSIIRSIFTEAKQYDGYKLRIMIPSYGQSTEISSIVKIPFENTLRHLVNGHSTRCFKEINRQFGILEKQLSLIHPVNCYSSIIITEQQRAVYSVNSFRVTFAMLTSPSSSISEMQGKDRDSLLTEVGTKDQEPPTGQAFHIQEMGNSFP